MVPGNPDHGVMAGRTSVAVLLSDGERFGPYFGGAIARWTQEVYACLGEEVDAQVFGFPTAPDDRYTVTHQTSGAWRLSRALARVPGLRRYEDTVWLRAIWERIRKFDVLHIHSRPQWVPIFRRWGYQGSLLLHLHNDHLGHWDAEALNVLASQLQGVAVCSDYLKNRFAATSPALGAKARVIYNGVNTRLFSPREELRESKTIFFVGRFDPEKGVLQLVRAFERVLARHPDARLVIGGTTGFGTHQDTPYVRRVRAEAAKLESRYPGCVQFPGYIHHDHHLPQWFQKATLLASPSLFQEPFGMVNAEAMACATPVVGSNRGGIPEVLGDAGILINPEDAGEFGDAMAGLLDDKNRRAGLGKASVERVREYFDWRVVAQTWTAFLEATRTGLA